MKKILIAVVVLLVVAALAVWLDPTRAVMGTLAGEAFFEGRPTSFWRSKLTAADPNDRESARQRLTSGGGQAVEVLIALLQRSGSDWEAAETRWTAAEILGQIGADAREAADPLIEAMRDDPDPHVRSVAAASVPAVGAPAEVAIPALLEQLRKQPSVVLARAISVYGPQAEPARDELIQLLNNQELDTELRWNAARTLGKLRENGAGAIDVLEAHLTDEADTVREHSAEALGDIGSQAERSVPALVAVLNDPATRVRRDASRSLGQIGGQAKQAVPQLADLLDDPEPIVRDAARTAIKTLDPEYKLPEKQLPKPEKDKNSEPAVQPPETGPDRPAENRSSGG